MFEKPTTVISEYPSFFSCYFLLSICIITYFSFNNKLYYRYFLCIFVYNFINPKFRLYVLWSVKVVCVFVFVWGGWMYCDTWDLLRKTFSFPVHLPFYQLLKTNKKPFERKKNIMSPEGWNKRGLSAGNTTGWMWHPKTQSGMNFGVSIIFIYGLVRRWISSNLVMKVISMTDAYIMKSDMFDQP